MFWHYIKISCRNIWNDKVYSLINILGLSVALSCCLALVFWVRFELSYENCFPNANRIFKVLEVERRDGGLHKTDWIRPGITKQLKENFPEIEAAAYINHGQLPFTFEDGEGIMLDHASVSSDFFKIFQYEYVEGSQDAFEHSEKSAIISEEAARKFFGDSSALGKTLSFSKDFLQHTIAGVVKMPKNTEVRFDMLTIDPKDWRYGLHYVLIKNNSTFSPETQQKLANFLSTLRNTKNLLAFQPIKEAHLHSSEELAANNRAWQTYGNWGQIWLFSFVALFVLIIAVINYINTSVARSMTRAKEVGVRKVFGSDQWQLIMRFLCESFIISFMSIVVAFFLAASFFPEFSALMGNNLHLQLDSGTILTSLGICILITLLSGGYASFYLSSLNPITAFKGGSATGSKEGLRKVLIGLQFFLSIVFLICTAFIYKQIHYVFTTDTGVDKNNIIAINTDLWYDSENFIRTIKRDNPNVIDATIANTPPYNATWNYSGVSWDGCPEEVTETEFGQIFCDHHYADVFGLELLEGRFIPSDLTWWNEEEDNSYSIVINETFAKLMNVDNPVGINVTYDEGRKEGKIVGIVKDFNFKPLKQPITPLIISYDPEAMVRVYVKTTGNNQQKTLQYVLETYREMYQRDRETNRPVIYSMVDDDYKMMYRTELRTSKVLLMFSVISLIISLFGIFGMTALMLERRTKEIAIRKIHGARIKDIILLFIRHFFGLICIATAVAIPTAYFITVRWIQDYAYRTSLSWWVFLSIVVLIFILTMALISLQVTYIARKNPVDSLRNE